MLLQWKPFKIDLLAFKDMLDVYCPNTDGIVANEQNFEIIEKNELTGAEIQHIEDYYDSLTLESETVKLNRKYTLAEKILEIKESAITKRFQDLTFIERKILFNLPFEESELG